MNRIRNNSYLYLIRQCFFYAGIWRRKFAWALVMLTGSHLIWLLRPLAVAGVINTLQQGGPEILTHVSYWLVGYALLETTPWAVWKPARQMERASAFHMRRALIDRFYGILQGLPIAWHQDHHSGDTINRVRKASDCLFQFGQNQYLYIMMVTQVLMALAVITYLAPWLGLIVISGTATLMLVLSRFDKYLIPMYSAENEGEHKIAATFFDYVSNITTIISLRLGSRTRVSLLEKIDRIWPVFNREIRLHENKYMSLTIGIVIMDLALITSYIWSEVNTHGTIMIGTTIAIWQYLRLMTDTFYNFANNYQQIIRWKTDFEATGQIEAAAGQVVETPMPTGVTGWQTLGVSGLSFSHRRPDEQDKHLAALSDIGFELKRGEKVALIGASGAGKSTLLAVLRGLYKPDRADIALDGQTMADAETLFGQTTLIPQDPEIFENTIRYNITVGLDVAEEDVQAAIRLAQFGDVVDRLPQGMESDIREKGVNLSGGEKQRLALARGLLAARGSSVVLMDEPTSSVDLLTESRIYQDILRQMPDTTILSSLHRLHLLPLFDRVLVLERGRIVQNGSFIDLKAQPGLFRNLWDDYQAQQARSAA